MNQLALRRTSMLAFAVCLLAGCGGSQSGGGSNPGVGTSKLATLGSAVATYSGTPKPLTSVSSGNVTVATLAGASFSNVTYNPAQTLASTYLTFSRNSHGDAEIYKWNYQGGAEIELTHDANGAFSPTASRYGKIFYSESNFGSFIGSCSSNGANPTTLTTSTGGSYYNIDPSPSGTTLAYDYGGGTLETVSVLGGTATALQSNDDDLGNAWFPSGKELAYVAYTGDYAEIFTTPVGGGTATNVTPTSSQGNGNWAHPTVNADGVSLAASFTASGASASQVVVFNTGAQNAFQITPPGNSDTFPSFSPDGSLIAFYRNGAGGATPGIYISDYLGTYATLVVPDSSTAGVVSDLTWSPFPVSEQLVGNAVYYSGSASGVLLSEVGSQFGSLLAFTATTPSTATIAAQQTNGGQVLAFTLSGNAITKIGYSNYYFGGFTTVTPPASTPSAVVTIDAETGAVDLVATAAVPAKAVSPSKTAGGTLTYTAKFTAIYDGTGKNLAASGASQMVVDGKTGHLLSFR